ncbi:hypothetical protein D3C87_498640 [compost metagenome]
MSKFLPQKKKLIEDVFEKASNEATETSFSGILKSLELKLSEDFGIGLSYKTLETYYVQLVQNEQDYNVKPLILEKLSNYLGYNNFNEYCAEWKTVEYSVKESISKVVINIINKPLLKMPEFLAKHSNLGIIGVMLCGSLVVGNKMYKADEPILEKTKIQDSVIQYQIPVVENSGVQTVVYVPQIANISNKNVKISEISLRQCMWWNGKEYVPNDCNDTKNGLVAIDMKMVDNFKKITTPDTITSIKNLWYSKHQNVVEFFTADGVNPENGKDLRPVTTHIFEKYLN